MRPRKIILVLQDLFGSSFRQYSFIKDYYLIGIRGMDFGFCKERSGNSIRLYAWQYGENG